MCLWSQFSQHILDQNWKSGTVLESWERADFKTDPDIGIWPIFEEIIEEIPNRPFFLGHGVHSEIQRKFEQWAMMEQRAESRVKIAW